jgi:hypothetical protein
MFGESISMEAVLIFVRGVFLIGACTMLGWAVLRWRRQMQVESSRLFEQLDLALVELRALSDAVQRLDGRLDALSGQVEAGTRQAPVNPGVAARGYDLALRLAKRGASIEELVGSCGITKHEAELLLRLHGTRSNPADSTASTPTAAAPASERKSQASWPIQTPAPAAAAPEPARNAVRKRGSLLSVA